MKQQTKSPKGQFAAERRRLNATPAAAQTPQIQPLKKETKTFKDKNICAETKINKYRDIKRLKEAQRDRDRKINRDRGRDRDNNFSNKQERGDRRRQMQWV